MDALALIVERGEDTLIRLEYEDRVPSRQDGVWHAELQAIFRKVESLLEHYDPNTPGFQTHTAGHRVLTPHTTELLIRAQIQSRRAYLYTNHIRLANNMAAFTCQMFGLLLAHGLRPIDHFVLRAARQGNVDVMRMLLAAGANPDAADADGPALNTGHGEIIDMLLAAGADATQVVLPRRDIQAWQRQVMRTPPILWKRCLRIIQQDVVLAQEQVDELAYDCTNPFVIPPLEQLRAAEQRLAAARRRSDSLPPTLRAMPKLTRLQTYI